MLFKSVAMSDNGKVQIVATSKGLFVNTNYGSGWSQKLGIVHFYLIKLFFSDCNISFGLEIRNFIVFFLLH